MTFGNPSCSAWAVGKRESAKPWSSSFGFSSKTEGMRGGEEGRGTGSPRFQLQNGQNDGKMDEEEEKQNVE